MAEKYTSYGYYTESVEYLLGVDWADARNKTNEFYTRDPFVMLCDDVYFMYGSNMISPELGDMGFSCRISKDKKNWSSIYDVTAGAIDWTGYEHFWSPEVIYRNGWFYMVASAKKTGEGGNGLMIMASQSPFGKFYNIANTGFANGFLTDASAHNYVDPHFWLDANVHCFYTESNNRSDPATSKPDVIYTSRFNSGLTALETAPYKVISADEVPWATSDVCTGAFVLKDQINGKAVMLFMADSENGRAIGQARADTIAGPWEISPVPLLDGDVGQATVFTDRLGKMMLAYHTPNTADYESGIVEHAKFVELEKDTNGWLKLATMERLITDRTQTDVNEVKRLAAKGWQNMTEAEKAEWVGELKGAYNASDLNRVESAVKYLSELLAELPDALKAYAEHRGVHWDAFFDVPYDAMAYGVTVKTDWVMSDIPTPSDMERYLANVVLLRNALQYAAADLPSDMDNLTYAEANAIEQAIKGLDKAIATLRDATERYIDNTSAAWFYSGDTYAGEATI